MKCPKCGQEMIHINNQHICTVCGIVANEFSPKDQVLNQIRAKVKAQTAQNAQKQEEYVSPVAVAKEENRPAEKKYTVPPVHMSDKTLDQMARALLVNQNSKADSSENENSEEIGAERVIPRIAEESVANEQVQEAAAHQQIQQNQTVQQPVEAQTINQEQQNAGFENQQENVGTSQVLQSSSIDFATEPAPLNSQMIYPSHQINPIFKKTLIVLFGIIVLFLVLYLLYKNFSGARALIDNITKYLGVSFIK